MTGLAFLMRIFSFFPSVIDHDESTYILIADALRDGQVYLRDVTDTKPIGIFTLFALFQSLFGESIVMIRIITTLWIALTAWMICQVLRLWTGRDTNRYNPAPVAGGIIYIFITSIYTFYGISPNTELFFNLFTIIALYLILWDRGTGWFVLAGLLLGIGFMIKYVVLFDAIAIGLFYLWRQWSAGKKWFYGMTRCVLMGLGFAVPFLVTWMYYRQLGMEATFLFFSFEVSGRYIINPPWHEYGISVVQFFLRYLPVSVWYFYCLWYWRSTKPDLAVLGALWSSLVIIIILVPGKLFGHYYIQFMLPFCLLAGHFFNVDHTPGRLLAWMRKPALGYPLLALIIIINMLFQKHDYFDKPDYSKEVANYLNARLEPGDILYTGNFNQIIYHLTHTKSPTPYIHRSLIWDIANNHALNIRQEEEWDNILDQNPRFVLLEKPVPFDNHLLQALRKSYRVVKTFGSRVEVNERN